MPRSQTGRGSPDELLRPRIREAPHERRRRWVALVSGGSRPSARRVRKRDLAAIVLFQAALQVCAEESRRVKQGQPSGRSRSWWAGRAAPRLPAGQGKLEAARLPKQLPTFETPIDSGLAPGQPDTLFSPSPNRVRGPRAEVQQPAEPPPSRPTRPVRWRTCSCGLKDLRIPPSSTSAPLPRPAPAGILGAGVGGRRNLHGAPELRPAARLGRSEPRPAPPLPRRAAVGSRCPARRSRLLPRPRRSPLGTAQPTAVPTPLPRGRPTPQAAAPGAGVKAAPIAPSDSGKPVPLLRRWQTAETMVSPNWAGRPPTYVIHFSSYRERSKAERDAVEISKQYGRPAYAAEVNLPAGACGTASSWGTSPPRSLRPRSARIWWPPGPRPGRV